MSVDAPRWSNLRHPRESLKNLIGGAGHHWKSILATATIAAGVAGVVEVAKIISESQLPNRPNLQQDEEKQPGGVMPSAIAFNEGVVATRVPESTATATSVPRVEPTKAPPVQAAEILPIAEVPNKLDALVAAINALPKSFNPDIKEEMFQSTKQEIENAADAVKKSLAKGDIEEARNKLTKHNLKGWIISLGDPLQSKFVPQEIKDEHDPQNLVIKKDRVDPRTFPYYLPVVEVYLGVLSAK